MYAYKKATNGKQHFIPLKNFGNPKSYILDNVMHHPPFSTSLIN